MAPIFFLPGLAEDFFRPLALSFVIALIVSLVVALTVTPALCLALLGGTQGGRSEPPLARVVQRGYWAMLAPSMRAPVAWLALAVVVIVAGLVALPFMNWSLLPSFKQTDLLIEWRGAPGTSLSAMNRVTAQVTQELRAIPGVRDVGSQIGRAVTGDQVVGSNSGELWVNLDPAAPYATTVAAVNAVIDGYPGLFRTVRDVPARQTRRRARNCQQRGHRAHLWRRPGGPA